MTRFRFLGSTSLLVAAALTLGACGSSEKAAEKAADKTTSAQTTAAATTEVLSGEDFVSRSPALSGSVVTLRRCSLLKTPGADGTLACRVLDNTSQQISDNTGLPVDIFIKPADLSPASKAVVDACDSICTVEISGKLDRATDGTGYLSMTAVSLKAVS